MFKVIFDGSAEKTLHKAVFGETMTRLVETDPDVMYLDADLMNSAGTYKLWQNRPDRAINCGISEANMMGVAAGLSVMGKKPYAHTFGPFASRRCYDQVFISQAYSENTVRIFGSDPGVAAAFNGGTHMPFEDMALYRAVPHSIVFDIADSVQFQWVLENVKDINGPLVYMRSTRKAFKAMYEPGSTFEIGKGNLIKDGSDLTIISSGLMVGEAMEAARLLEAEGISARVVDMFTVKPIDKDLVKKCADETGAILTTENHNVIGGLGDAVLGALSETGSIVPVLKHGVYDVFGQVGPQDYLQEVYGLNAKTIVEKAKAVLKLKK